MATLYHPTASQLNAHEGGISCVAWGHGLVVTGSADEAVHSYDVSGAKIERRHTLTGHELGVTAVAVAADVAVAASAALDSRIRVWNLDTGSLNLEIDCGPMSYGVALSPDGATVAAGSMGGISLWDAASGSKTASLSIGSDRIVLCAAISADGALLAAGAEDGGVHVFEMEAPYQRVAKMEAHAVAVRCVAFSRDGKTVLSGSEDSRAVLWEAASGRQLYTLQGHGSWVLGAAFSADGSHVVTCSSDQTVRNWDLTTGASVQTLADSHSDQAWGVAFDPSGGRFCSVGDDRAIRVFEATVAGGE